MDNKFLGVYAVKDKLSNRFGLPQTMDNEDVAKRSFEMVAEQEGTLIHYRPGDFDLYFLGQFDPLTGFITPFKKPVLIMSGFDLSCALQGAPTPENMK